MYRLIVTTTDGQSHVWSFATRLEALRQYRCLNAAGTSLSIRLETAGRRS